MKTLDRAGLLLAAAAVVSVTLAIQPVAAQDETTNIVVADFEMESYTQWHADGEAFGTGPALGTLDGQMQVTGFIGKRLVNSFLGGDQSTGTLTSDPFKARRKYLTFLIGGGGHIGKTCMNLVVDGSVVRTATGNNTAAGGSENLELAFWDISDLAGQSFQLQIVDLATGGWGHINVDQIIQTDTRPKLPEFATREKSFVVAEKYLVLPIENDSANKGTVQLFVDDIEVRRYDLSIAKTAQDADWYAFFDLQAYRGKPARVVASNVTESGFSCVEQSENVPGEDKYFTEPHRPQFHFTQKVGWINDPNGMVYQDGTWHFFFQHNPVGLPWGNMTWGHATSSDLLHWQQQPNKLFPKTMAKGDCFSGGATVDKHNTAGFGHNALVAFLTDTGQGEAIAYSTDQGKTFTWYAENPVVKHQGRDPKVIWYAYDKTDTPLNAKASELGGHWVMVVYDEHADHGQNAAFYTSTNLTRWNLEGHLPGYFECTELFELPVYGDHNERRWVVFAADAKYAIGSFDGKIFKPSHVGKHQLHYGNYYASQTFDNAPDGRRIQMGWLRIDSPGPYNQHFSFPHQLSLRTTADGPRMFAEPISEIAELRSQSHTLTPRKLSSGAAEVIAVESDLLDVTLSVAVGDAKTINLDLPGRLIRYDVQRQLLDTTPLKLIDGKISIRVLCDRSITEIIGNDGRVFISQAGPQAPAIPRVSVRATGGDAELLQFEAHELNSIWSPKAADQILETAAER